MGKKTHKGTREKDVSFEDIICHLSHDPFGSGLEDFVYDEVNDRELERKLESYGLVEDGEYTEKGELFRETVCEIAKELMQQETFNFGEDNGVIKSSTGGYTIGAKPSNQSCEEDIREYVDELGRALDSLTTKRGENREKWLQAFQIIGDHKHTSSKNYISQEIGLSNSTVNYMVYKWEKIGLVENYWGSAEITSKGRKINEGVKALQNAIE